MFKIILSVLMESLNTKFTVDNKALDDGIKIIISQHFNLPFLPLIFNLQIPRLCRLCSNGD